MTGYSVSIISVNKELTAKERIKIKDTTDALKLDDCTQAEAIVLYPTVWAELDVHNENSENKDYKNFIIIDNENRKFVTGSESFWSSFIEIAEEMKNEPEEWGIKVYRMPSKKYNGKTFITCSIE